MIPNLMIKKLTIFFILMLLSACSFVFDSVKMQYIQSEPTYNVAVLLPLTGRHEKIGKSLLNAINLSYNQNPNKYIVLKIYDTKGDVKLSEKIAKQVLSDGNKAVLGPLLGEEAIIIAKILEKADIPVFTFSNDLTIINNSSNLYTLSPLPSTEIEASIDYASKNLKSKNFAILVPNNKYGEVMFASIQKSLKDRNLNLVRYVAYPTNTARIMPYVRRILPRNELLKYEAITRRLANKEEIFDAKRKQITRAPQPKLDFDTLIIADFGSRVSVLASHLPSLGISLDSVNVIGLSNWETPEIYTNSLLKKAYFASLIDYTSTPFAKKYEEYYGDSPKLLEITAYDSVITLMSLVYKDTEGNLVNNFTNAHITSIKLKGISGNFIITNNRTAIRNASIKQINRTKGGIVTIKEDIDLNTFAKNYNNGSLVIEKLKLEP